jgi:hypothetical protein
LVDGNKNQSVEYWFIHLALIFASRCIVYVRGFWTVIELVHVCLIDTSLLDNIACSYDAIKLSRIHFAKIQKITNEIQNLHATASVSLNMVHLTSVAYTNLK